MRAIARLGLAGLLAALVLGLAPPASAQVYVNVPPPAVGGSDSGGPDGGPGVNVLGTQFRATSEADVLANRQGRTIQVLGVGSTRRATNLALTGSDLLVPLFVLALVSVAAGVGLRWRARAVKG